VLIENEAIKLLHQGESYGMHYDISKIPLDKLSLNHAAYGLDYYLNENPASPNPNIPPPVSPNNNDIEIRRAREQTIVSLEERRRLRQLHLEQQIKSQNLH